MINKKFSYVKAIVCGVLALSCATQAFAASEDQMGISIRAGGGMLFTNLMKTELKDIDLMPFFPEQTKKSATATSTEDNNDSSSKSSLTASTDGDTAKNNKLTIENPIIGFVSVNYDIISAGLEGGFALSAGIEGNFMSGYKMTAEIADGQSVDVKGGKLNSGALNLEVATNKYKTANGAANNKFIIEQKMGYGGGLVLNAGYAINDSFEIRFGAGLKLLATKYTMSGTYDLVSDNATTTDNFSHALKGSMTSDETAHCYLYNGALNVGFVFKLTEFVDVNLQAGVSYFSEVKPKFSNVTLTNSENTYKVKTLHGTAAELDGATAVTPADFADLPEARFYAAAAEPGQGAGAGEKKYALLAVNDTVVHKGTAIQTNKVTDVEKTIPSVIYGEVKLSVGFTF